MLFSDATGFQKKVQPKLPSVLKYLSSVGFVCIYFFIPPRTVRVWDLAKAKLVHTLRGHTDEIEVPVL